MALGDLATPPTYVDLRDQPLRTRTFTHPKFSTWPPRVAHQEHVELVVPPATVTAADHRRTENAVYGGGMVHGPLTQQQVDDITAAGHAALLTTEYLPGG